MWLKLTSPPHKSQAICISLLGNTLYYYPSTQDATQCENMCYNLYMSRVNKKRIIGKDMAPMPDAELWEQQPQETSEAWHAFRTFRDMGPSRNNPKVTVEIGKHISIVNEWSARWAWRDRVRAWNIHLDRQAQETRGEIIREMRERHATLGRKLLDKFMKRVDTLDVDEIPPGSLDRMLKAGAEIERAAVGEATLIVEHKADAGIAAIAEHMKNPIVRDMLDGLAELMESDSKALVDIGDTFDGVYTVVEANEEVK